MPKLADQAIEWLSLTWIYASLSVIYSWEGQGPKEKNNTLSFKVAIWEDPVYAEIYHCFIIFFYTFDSQSQLIVYMYSVNIGNIEFILCKPNMSFPILKFIWHC